MTPLEHFDTIKDIQPLLHRIAYPPPTRDDPDLCPLNSAGSQAKANRVRRIKMAIRSAATGNELRLNRISRDLIGKDILFLYGIGPVRLNRVETTEGYLTEKDKETFRPVFGNLVDMLLTVGHKPPKSLLSLLEDA